MMRKAPIRRGVAAVMAMLYLVLFSTLALGFYAATTMSSQVTANEQRACGAQLAAESGMDFVRYQLANVSIPHGTPQSALFDRLYQSLEGLMDNTGNLVAIGRVGNVINIPEDTAQFINLDGDGARFRASIEDLGQKVRVRVLGRHNDPNVVRVIEMDYAPAQNASQVFDFGVASRGKITTSGNAKIRGATDPKKGSVLSTCMTDPIPVVIEGKEVSGDISVTNPNATIAVKQGSSVGGTSNPSQIAAYHLHKGVAEPEFPVVDTSAFKAFATTVYTPGMTVFDNVRIPANTNPPKFNANVTIKGVLYIEMPNKIEFAGNANVQGVIVTDTPPDNNGDGLPDGTGTLATNTISFTGSVAAQGVDTLPASYGELRKLTGSFLLAPNFAVSFTGNFGTINGSIIASKISMTGNATGTVYGSVINLENQVMSAGGSSELIIASTGTTNYPAGVFFSSHYVPLADTWREVKP